MDRKPYADQVRLLVKVLPFVAKEKVFALKGGTAINLFYHDLPRLSVDIDLTYLPVEDRATSLKGIDEAMDRIKDAIHAEPKLKAVRIHGASQGQTRVMAGEGRTRIKIETTPVARGVVMPCTLMRVQSNVEKEFGFAETKVVSFEDLYAGKICAALDRQHPRDLFDIKYLYEEGGITDQLYKVFLIYSIFGNQPIHEILSPNKLDISKAYEKEFVGMTNSPVSLEELEDIRERLFDDIKSRLSGDNAAFIRSVQACEPHFGLLGLTEAAKLPAILWKLRNLNILKEKNPQKYKNQTDLLNSILK